MNQPIRPLAIGRPLLSPVKNNTGLYSDLGTPDEFLVAEVQGGQNPDSELGMYVRLFLAAPEMYESLRDAILFMQFLGKKERPLSAEEQEWLSKAVLVLAKIEGGGE